ncbi:MAG: putative baseplate assembly protein [Pyrinomonadaceae bacterium]
MPLPIPILDDRSYQQLRDELVRRIPVYTPEWTDHNASDPGITLIELFAFLGENLLYRFNQIPETTRLAFLRLLQIPLRPASPAAALVTMTTAEPKGSLVDLYAEAKAGGLSFETLIETHVWPISLTAIGKIQSAPPDQTTEPEVYEFAVLAADAIEELEEGKEPVYYENQTVPPDGGGVPVDFDATVDGMLWVAVLAEKGADKKELRNGLVNLGFVPDTVAPSLDLIDACPGAGVGAKAPAVEWQISSGKLATDGAPLYSTITVEADTTRGLSQEGVVRLRLPRKADDFGIFNLSNPDLQGTGQFPPALDDETAAKVLFWLRAFRRDRSRFGKVLFVGANAAEARQTRRARPEFLGTGNGQPHQTYPLVHKPVIEGSLVVQVEEVGGWKTWAAVDGFYASNPDDRHYMVDLEAGHVIFGNGVQGLPPQIGWRIRAVEYRYGGGAAGNVPPKAISKLADFPSVKITNPLRAHGGGASESIEAALERIPGELRRHDRAVTATDFQELALMTPGANVGRAECLARFYPRTQETEAAGVVSVVVWPQEDPVNPNAPLPDRNLLRAVCAWLDLRRLITTELYVIPPTYRKVAVAVGLKIKPGYGVEAVRRWVELVIRQYLAPLPPFGPSGNGWPLGRRVHGPELEAVALQVEGVEFLEDLKVAGWDAGSQAWVAGSVELEIYEVPELTEIAVVDGLPVPEPGQGIVPPDSDTVPVPIPIIREEC